MYNNPFTPGYEVLSKSGSYNIDSHGSIATTASYLVTNDFPDYAASSMFYHPTEHEQIASIKYGNFEPGYHNLNEIRESMNGPPIEFYIPQSNSSMEGNASINTKPIEPEIVTDKLLEKVKKEALQEINMAQSEVSGKNFERLPSRKIKKIEVEEVFMLRKRRRTIVFDDKQELI